MSAPRRVSLRILREGPTHNHLLSPLTPYLAVVGRHEAATIRVPYEHRRLLRDLAALRYGATAHRGPELKNVSAPDRRLIADDVSRVLEAVPGLTAELGGTPQCHPGLVHLELVFSAAELSLLPFELATSPRGFPGEGMPLSVQVTTPLVMTRTIPGAAGRHCRYAGRPKILFAWASPPELAEVPHQAHLAALLHALEPWTGPLDRKELTDAKRLKAVAEFLTVIPRASRQQLEAECRKHRYTHVHILAHSTVREDGSEPYYALALEDARGGAEYLNAERLQAALRLPLDRPDDASTLSHPIVVTLATCDSGNQAQVIYPSMSLAHGLHAAGVPLVVGSLFPITFRGSVLLTGRLYKGLLEGKDPRWVLYDTRHELFRMDEHCHDWASMVVYASLPDDIDEQALDMRYLAGCAAVSTHNGLLKLLVQALKGATEPERTRLLAEIDRLDEKVLAAESHLPREGVYIVEGLGTQASAEKKRAEQLFHAAAALDEAEELAEKRMELILRSITAARTARSIYQRAARIPPWRIKRPQIDTALLPTLHWVLTQALSLSFVLERSVDPVDWHAAVSNARSLTATTETELGIKEPNSDAIWAYGSLAELYLLAHGMRQSPQPQPLGAASDARGTPAEGDVWPENSEQKAKQYLAQLVGLARRTQDPSFVASTRGQLSRYAGWWLQPAFVQALFGQKLLDQELLDQEREDVEGQAVSRLSIEMMEMLR